MSKFLPEYQSSDSGNWFLFDDTNLFNYYSLLFSTHFAWLFNLAPALFLAKPLDQLLSHTADLGWKR